jgi:hypothetical protein
MSILTDMHNHFPNTVSGIRTMRLLRPDLEPE